MGGWSRNYADYCSLPAVGVVEGPRVPTEGDGERRLLSKAAEEVKDVVIESEVLIGTARRSCNSSSSGTYYTAGSTADTEEVN